MASSFTMVRMALRLYMPGCVKHAWMVVLRDSSGCRSVSVAKLDSPVQKKLLDTCFVVGFLFGYNTHFVKKQQNKQSRKESNKPFASGVVGDNCIKGDVEAACGRVVACGDSDRDDAEGLSAEVVCG